MANGTDNQGRIEAAVERARGRWLTSAMINAGGRWAVLPAGVAALLAIVLALVGVHSLLWLLPLTLLGIAGAMVALVLTRRSYAQPAAAGAPDWTLLLDRALGLHDALPTWLESDGRFRAAMEAGIAARLDPKREKHAAPARHWGALVVVLLLALMPLAFWRPAPDQPNTDQPQVAKQDKKPAPEKAEGGGDGQAKAAGGNKKGDRKSPGKTDGKGGKGKQGEVQKRPDGQKSKSGGAGKPPPDAKPQPTKSNPPPKEGGTGDKPKPPTSAPKKPDQPADTDLTHVKPDAGKGETRSEDRSRWVYNPDAGKPHEGTPTPPDVQHPGERAVPRTKVTSRERKLLEHLYKKLYE